ncbi:hypothetical protein SAMN02745135_01992 [Caloranaerobacter azorensis DSM 13643]|uniref:Uncharacterized protein n=1 Tax=Caloranaerobacter azorensis DSM 13643 TaxID=1121264 RepID=A0A1M5VKT7_9FIRM|nr:hypothetical protein [Caloranaerobacter azorensis]SHH75882.1 hypothetical protein SAMN02745135_01992 [Caloranaerobacter azorensis DSM 13643]
MSTIKIEPNLLISISIEECLNYTPFEKLENSIKYHVKSLIKKVNRSKYKNLSKDEKLQYFLTQLLLRTSSNPNWANLKDSEQLDQRYLYTVIKKYMLIYIPELL